MVKTKIICTLGPASSSQALSTREIGKRMGVSHVSVVKMMHKIRAKSKKHLD